MALNRVTNRLYALDGNSLLGIDIASGQLRTSLDLSSYIGMYTWLSDVAVNAVTDRVYVAVSGRFGGEVLEIDGSSGQIIRPVSPWAKPLALVVDETFNRLYILDDYSYWAVIYDLQTLDRIATFESSCSGLLGLALDSKAERLYAATGPYCTAEQLQLWVFDTGRLP
jgi:DNA-binding beta-propeller fold protein YncE